MAEVYKMKQIHWYPGHMKKAQIEVQDRLKLVDLVIELLDARIPVSSRNETLFKITQNKPRLVVLTKADLADKKVSKDWIKHFESKGFAAIFADLNKESDIKNIIREAEKLGEAKNAKIVAKGMKPQPIRAMVLGIPNVGKSTLINKMAKRHAASVQNKPGHTKAQQWIKVSNTFELLDTPGILQPSYENKEIATNLALVGSINNEILPNEELARIAFEFLKEHYKDNLLKRFNYINIEEDFDTSFRKIAQKRGYLSKGGEDMEKTSKVFLNELKNGVLGEISIERI